MPRRTQKQRKIVECPNCGELHKTDGNIHFEHCGALWKIRNHMLDKPREPTNEKGEDSEEPKGNQLNTINVAGE